MGLSEDIQLNILEKKNIVVLSSKKKKGFEFFDLKKKINETNLKKTLKGVETVVFCSSLKISNNKYNKKQAYVLETMKYLKNQGNKENLEKSESKFL